LGVGELKAPLQLGDSVNDVNESAGRSRVKMNLEERYKADKLDGKLV
jgi:hypothetical protein